MQSHDTRTQQPPKGIEQGHNEQPPTASTSNGQKNCPTRQCPPTWKPPQSLPSFEAVTRRVHARHLTSSLLFSDATPRAILARCSDILDRVTLHMLGHSTPGRRRTPAPFSFSFSSSHAKHIQPHQARSMPSLQVRLRATDTEGRQQQA